MSGGATGAVLRATSGRPMLDPAWTPAASYGHAQGLLGLISTEGANMKRSDLKQLEAELADGYELVPVPRRQGRFFVQGPDGERVKLNADRSERPVVVGGNTTPGSLHKVRSALQKAGCLR